MALQIKSPQAFVYMARIPAVKKIKGIVFKHGEAVFVHDPKVIRLLSQLPYMRASDNAAAPIAKAPKAKAEATNEIPPDWRGQHWKRRVAWAKAIAGAEITTTSEADRILAEHMGEMPVSAPVEALQVEA